MGEKRVGVQRMVMIDSTHIHTTIKPLCPQLLDNVVYLRRVRGLWDDIILMAPDSALEAITTTEPIFFSAHHLVLLHTDVNHDFCRQNPQLVASG